MELNQDASEAERGQPASTLPPGESVTGSPSCLSNWRRWIRPVFYVVYGLVVLSTLPLIILDIVHGAKGAQSLKITLAGVAFFAMVMSIPISVWGIINHIVCFTRPAMQKYIIRILWMIPIYELCSWFALRFPASAVYLDTLRQLYQAYVIYNFVFYILTFFEEVPNFDNRMIMKPQIKSPPPCCCVKAVPNQRIINRCKAGILSYMVIRIVFTIVSIITNLTNTFKEGDYSPQSAYLWVTVIVTVSQIWTMFCLALLRKSTQDELQMLPKSTSQFIGIQLVVIVDNFQSILINLFAQFWNPKPEWGFDGDQYQFARMIQDFVICLEMVFCAFFLSYSFDYQRYNTDSGLNLSFSQSFKQMWNLSDVKSNIMDHLKSRGKSTTEEQNNPVQTDQPTAASPATPQASPQAKEEVEAPRRRKEGHQFISLPDIIVIHQDEDNSDHIAEIHDDSDQKQKGSNQNERPEKGGIKHIGVQGKSAHHALNPNDDEFGDLDGDSDGDSDDFIESDFLTDDDDSDDSDDNDLPVNVHLDIPFGATSTKRRVKKVSYTEMTFDDMDVDTLKVPESETTHKSPNVAKRRVKKVSYSGMTFDDMDWEQIRSDYTPAVDSETAPGATGIVERNEKKYKLKNMDKEGERVGSSEA